MVTCAHVYRTRFGFVHSRTYMYETGTYASSYVKNSFVVYETHIAVTIHFEIRARVNNTTVLKKEK